ncbi:MAG: hypothetical protein R3234_13415, partial [Thermoanaerobaculia bacterium]|nr:hypothetical protein [Thermoanaerobaculia bacterium]
MSRSSVEIVYFSGCPHADQARRIVRRALEITGRPSNWSEWDQASNTVPTRYRGLPSPTVLVDGEDVAGPAPSTEGSFSCRAGGAPEV